MKLIFHIDVNSAFLSWTACGLLEDGETGGSVPCAELAQDSTLDPANGVAAVNVPASQNAAAVNSADTTSPPVDIREIAAVIGGSEKSRHGIVLAKSTLAKQYGIENDTITGSQEYKNAVLDYAKKMAQLTYEACVDTAKYENFYNKAAETLERAKIPEETVSLFKDYVVKVSKTCDNLTEAQQKEYAKELFDAIENSELQKEAKEEVTSTTNVLINSSIYWDKQ